MLAAQEYSGQPCRRANTVRLTAVVVLVVLQVEQACVLLVGAGVVELSLDQGQEILINRVESGTTV